MIKVIYYRNYNRVTVEGHANSGEPGHDLVCAAASTLAYTLAANVANMADNRQLIIEDMELCEGKAEIRCKPHHRFKATVSMVMAAVCVGFELLAHDYPQYITYEIHG